MRHVITLHDSIRQRLGLLVALLLLSGCAVGPDFRAPDAPGANGYTPEPLPAHTRSTETPAGAAQEFSVGAALPADWWTLFHCEALDALVRGGLRDSPTLAAAQAALRGAQATQQAQQASLFVPGVDGSLGATRERVTGAQFGQPNVAASTFTLYSATVAVSYRLDLFGGSRRLLEAYRAQTDYQRAELEAAYLTLTANLVTTAVAEASARGQLSAIEDALTSERAVLAIVERRFAAGAVSRTDVLAQRTQVAQTEALAPALKKALTQSRHRLAILSGRTPDVADLPTFALEDFTLPSQLPVSLPSALVRQRPDIQAAEALLHQASAEVGVATANLYPQINLSGSLGSESVMLGSLFGAGTSFWTLGGSLTQPLFHGGALTARRRAAIANLDQAAATYRQVVLSAFGDVADTLHALDNDADALRAAADVAAAAQATFDLTRHQYDAGGVSYLTLLNAQRQYHEARQGRVRAVAARYADTAALFQALGGGWWNRGAPIAAVDPTDGHPAAIPSP